jgi:hypothetical protein
VAQITEILLVGGVALDLVGAGVLSHAHNAESIVELREDIGEEEAAVGEPDALSTHAQLLAEKRIGFLLLTLGLVLYLSGIVLKSPEGLAMMGTIAAGVVVAGLVRGFPGVFTAARFGAPSRSGVCGRGAGARLDVAAVLPLQAWAGGWRRVVERPLRRSACAGGRELPAGRGLG